MMYLNNKNSTVYIIVIFFCLWTGLCIFGTWYLTTNSNASRNTGKVIAESEETLEAIKEFLAADSVTQKQQKHKFDSLVNRLDSTLHSLDSLDVVMDAKVDSISNDSVFSLPDLDDL